MTAKDEVSMGLMSNSNSLIVRRCSTMFYPKSTSFYRAPSKDTKRISQKSILEHIQTQRLLKFLGRHSLFGPSASPTVPRVGSGDSPQDCFSSSATGPHTLPRACVLPSILVLGLLWLGLPSDPAHRQPVGLRPCTATACLQRR